jgi:hypothetical protein
MRQYRPAPLRGYNVKACSDASFEERFKPEGCAALNLRRERGAGNCCDPFAR